MNDMLQPVIVFIACSVGVSVLLGIAALVIPAIRESRANKKLKKDVTQLELDSKTVFQRRKMIKRVK